MKFNLLTIVLLFVVSFSQIKAQKFEMGKVSISELEQKEHPKDPSAVAAILFKKGEASLEYTQDNGFMVMTKVKTRIKIYKKEGYELANQEVRYYLDYKFGEIVNFSSATTYNLTDGKIEKTKLKSDGEFDQKVNKYIGLKKISFPNVKEGSIIEFEYVVKSKYIESLREWDFQSSIPVNFSEFITYVPEYFVYNTSQKGFIFPKVTVEKKERNFILKTKESPNNGGLNGQGSTRTTYSEDKIDYEETQTTYLAENLPALREEGYVNNINNYASSVSFELSMLKIPNRPFKSYSTDWETVTKTIYEYDDFGPELDKTGYFEEDINRVISGLKTRDEIIDAVFNFVKSNVKWNNYNGYSCNDGVKKAYKDKTGNVAEINLMLTAMLRYAGISANPVLISTRSNGIALFPNRTAFNYVIAAVETQNGMILLDATEKYSTPNILPLRAVNWQGRLIRKDGTSEVVDLTPKAMSKESVFLNLVLKSDGSVDGKIRNQLSDHEALYFRQKNILTSNASYLEQLENKNNAIEISDYIRENDLDVVKPIMEMYAFKDTKSVEIIENKIYVSPMLFLTAKENPFKQEVREYPIDFGFPVESKYNINLEIPEGYIVESMPKSMNIATGDDIGAFKYIIANTDNKIQISITSTIYAPIVSADYYDVLKSFFQKMIDKQNEKIVLKKV